MIKALPVLIQALKKNFTLVKVDELSLVSEMKMIKWK